jgi:hypothetical protein
MKNQLEIQCNAQRGKAADLDLGATVRQLVDQLGAFFAKLDLFRRVKLEFVVGGRLFLSALLRQANPVPAAEHFGTRRRLVAGEEGFGLGSRDGSGELRSACSRVCQLEDYLVFHATRSEMWGGEVEAHLCPATSQHGQCVCVQGIDATLGSPGMSAMLLVTIVRGEQNRQRRSLRRASKLDSDAGRAQSLLPLPHSIFLRLAETYKAQLAGEAAPVLGEAHSFSEAHSHCV